mgnify:FL=1
MLNITKLDRRHTGYNVMKYYIEVNRFEVHGKDERTRFFKDYRAWCWDQFGPGCELDYVAITLGTTSIVTPEEKIFGLPTREMWAWRTDYDNQRIFLKSDRELSWFKLKWVD